MPLPSASLSLATRRAWIRTPGPFLGWAGVAVCALYAGFGVYTAVLELLSLAGMVAPVPTGRAAPPMFVLHALTGSVALVCAALQLRLASRLLSSRPRVHRAIGRTYVLATWITSAGGLITVAFFDVSWPGKVVFAAWAISWSTATAVALHRVRAGRYGEHREWMLRSFALALVFMTFDLSRSAFVSLGLPHTAVYPLGLLLSSALSLTVAELWIHRSRGRSAGRVPPGQDPKRSHGVPPARTRLFHPKPRTAGISGIRPPTAVRSSRMPHDSNASS